ncbi:MAG: hypothetical protein H0W44_10320 [Gammaproteobacteria bacterium]|nr:hypothetical protein [Gammaproteobacteria bacterium]
MSSLQQRMAEHGFESNEHYDYIVRCLHAAPGNDIRCLNIEGESGRRKTAFANALAHALTINHILYHDFAQAEIETAAPIVIKEDDESDARPVLPIKALDKIMSDACALSEAEPTVLILDQLQIADFKEHIRLYKFLIERQWNYNDVSFYAHRKNFFLFLIAEEPLYHSLQKHSLKVWVRSASDSIHAYQHDDFNLDADAQPVIDALNQCFRSLNVFPTQSEYYKILHDIRHHVHTASELAQSIYGWTEGLDRELLHSPALHNQLTALMPVIENYIGVEEIVELSSAPEPSIRN